MATGARFRPPRTVVTPAHATKRALKMLARRYQHLTTEIEKLDVALAPLVKTTAPRLTGIYGIGIDVAEQLLVTAGDNPGRRRNHASFAHLCGASPIEASSGQTTRHRLNCGGDRQANAALHRVAITRMGCDPRTQAYVQRRTTQGKSKREIIRCLKRYIARKAFAALRTDLP